jgi:methyl-accepting chemotaxis protein
MGQITQAIREQSQTSSQLAEAAGQMNHLTLQVSGATREQARSSEQISGAIAAMNRMTQQVSRATVEQSRSGDQVVSAVEHIQQAAQESTHTASQMAEAAALLRAQAGELVEVIAFFKDDQRGPQASKAGRELVSSIERVESPRGLRGLRELR